MRRSPPLIAAVFALAACGDSTPNFEFAKACAKEQGLKLPMG